MSDVFDPVSLSVVLPPEGDDKKPMWVSSSGRDPSLYDENDEFLLREDHNRFVLFPIKHEDIWLLYKQAQASIWSADEIDLEEDVRMFWNVLDDKSRRFVSRVFAYFAASDGIVLENLAKRFMVEIKVPEVRAFLTFAMYTENVHSETYCIILDRLIPDGKEKEMLFDAINRLTSVKAKAQWAIFWMDSGKSFAERLFAFILVEGLMFSASFCCIYWLKKMGLMPGVTFSNDLITRDEGLHYVHLCLLYSKLEWKLAPWRAYQITNSALHVESLFVEDALPDPLLGMNKSLMIQYVRYVADKVLVKTGYEKIYRAENPFDWMETISMNGKTNFFERRVPEYQKSGILASSQERKERQNGTYVESQNAFDGESVEF